MVAPSLCACAAKEGLPTIERDNDEGRTRPRAERHYMSNETSPATNPFQMQDGIFIHHVPEKEMQSSLTGRRQLDVPRGHIAVVVYKDKGKQTVEILPSGVQVAVGLLERFASFYTNSIDRKSFYVVSRQPISVISAPVQFQDGAGRSLSVRALVSVSAPMNDGDRLVELIEALLGQDVFVETSNVRSQLAPVVEQAMRGALVKSADGSLDTHATTSALKKALEAQLGRIGFAFDVSLSSGAPRIEVEIRLGEAPAPALKKCVNVDCTNMLQQTKKFCGKCGTGQPIATTMTMGCFECGNIVAVGKRFCGKCGAEQKPATVINEALYTSDGEQLRVFLSLLVEGYAGRSDDTRIHNAVQAVLRSQLQRMTVAQLTSREALAAFQESIKLDIEAAVASVGGRVVGIGALDVRQTNGEWILQARAELERAKNEANLDREWLARDAEELELNGLQYEMAMRRVALENDHALAKRSADLEREFQQEKLQLDQAQRQQSMRLDAEFAQTGTQLDHDTLMQGRQLDAEFAQTGTQLDHDVRMQGRQLDASFDANGQLLTDAQRQAVRDVEHREARESVRDRDATQDIRDADRSARTDLAIDNIEGDAREEQRDRDAAREVRGAQRVSTTTVAVDQAERQGDRAVRAEDKVDALQNITDERDVSRQQRAAGRETTAANREDQMTGLQHDHTVATQQQDNVHALADDKFDHDMRRDEKQLDNELQREQKVAAHDLKLKAEVSHARRTQADDDSYLSKLKAEDTSHESRLQADDALYEQRNQQEFAEDVADRAVDRKHRDADLTVNREQSVADREIERDLSADERRKRAQIEQLAAVKNMEAAEVAAAHAQGMDRQRLEKEHEMEKARLAAEERKESQLRSNDLEKERLAALKDAKSENALIMMAATMDEAKVRAIAETLRTTSQDKLDTVEARRHDEKEEARQREEKEEARRRDEKVETEARRREEREEARQREEGSQNMFQRFLEMQQADKQSTRADMLELSKSAMATQQAKAANDLAAAQDAAGRDRTAAKDAADREREALRGASHQAVSMAERSMGSMSQVATQAATHGPTVVMPVTGGGAAVAAAPTVVAAQEATARQAPSPRPEPVSKVVARTCGKCAAVIAEAFCEECGPEVAS